LHLQRPASKQSGLVVLFVPSAQTELTGTPRSKKVETSLSKHSSRDANVSCVQAVAGHQQLGFLGVGRKWVHDKSIHGWIRDDLENNVEAQSRSCWIFVDTSIYIASA